MFRTFHRDSRFQNQPDTVVLQKYQSLSEKSFRHNSSHMPFLNLTSTLSFEPRFHMFIINNYDRKSKRLLSLVFILKKKGETNFNYFLIFRKFPFFFFFFFFKKCEKRSPFYFNFFSCHFFKKREVKKDTLKKSSFPFTNNSTIAFKKKGEVLKN